MDNLMAERVHPQEYKHFCMKRFSWTAVFVGAFIGMGIAFLLNLFSIAIGLSAYATTAGVTTVAVGGLIGVAIGTIVSMFVAGWTAGYLGRPFCEKRNLGVLYGFTAWCIALIITSLVAVHVGRYIGGYSKFISNPAGFTWQKPSLYVNTSAQNQPSDTTDQNTTQDTAKTAAAGAFVVFVLFFLGALASCFGGHAGMVHRCKKETVVE